MWSFILMVLRDVTLFLTCIPTLLKIDFRLPSQLEHFAAIHGTEILQPINIVTLKGYTSFPEQGYYSGIITS